MFLWNHIWLHITTASKGKGLLQLERFNYFSGLKINLTQFAGQLRRILSIRIGHGEDSHTNWAMGHIEWKCVELFPILFSMSRVCGRGWFWLFILNYQSNFDKGPQDSNICFWSVSYADFTKRRMPLLWWAQQNLACCYYEPKWIFKISPIVLSLCELKSVKSLLISH